MALLLVVDDDPLSLETWGYVLRDAGHRLETATSGSEALTTLRAREFDLVVSDLLLGDMTAIDVLTQIAADRRPPVIVITGFATVETAVAAMRHGALNYLLKPLSAEDLIRHVEQTLAHVARIAHVAQVAHEPPPGPPQDHPAERWAQAVAGLAGAPRDARTISHWARAIGTSTGALRTWCQMAGQSAKRSLTLARLIRATHQAQRGRLEPTRLLDVTDPRTLRRMLSDGGMLIDAPPTLEDLLARQTLISDPAALAALRQALTRTRTRSE